MFSFHSKFCVTAVRYILSIINWFSLFISLSKQPRKQQPDAKSDQTVRLIQANELLVILLKCYYDQILDTHFFTFSYTTGLPELFCQISIYYEQCNSCFLDLYLREFKAAINFPCSKSGLRIGENDVIFSKIPHGLKL